MSIKVSTSILSADFCQLEWMLKDLEKCGSDYVHCDVMDGVFVPNISFGVKPVADIRKHTKMTVDTHLMIVNPQNYINQFVDAGSDIITVHPESAPEDKIFEALNNIKSQKVKCGIAFNPETPFSKVEKFVHDCDVVMVMTVRPGFGGQKLMLDAVEKIRQVKQFAQKHNLTIDIEADGGITADNAALVKNAGANIIVAGSAIVNVDDNVRMNVIKSIRTA